MLGRVSTGAVDLIEETYLAVTPRLVAEAIRAPEFLRSLWPDLDLTVFTDRGEAGVRWSVTGALVGSAEIWLEPQGDGVIAHTYLRTAVTRDGSSTEPETVSARRVTREIRRRAMHAKAVWWQLKDTLEASRRPGEPAVVS